MNPNQQPQTPPNYGPQPPAGPPAAGGYPTTPQLQPVPQPQAAPISSFATPTPQTPSSFNTYEQTAPRAANASYRDGQQETYDIDYLDKIAPPPPPPSFLSGTFGKVFIGLIVIFVLAVSIIIAVGNQDKTGPTTEIAVRTENLGRVTKQFHARIKSDDLASTNSKWQTWLANTNRDATALLIQAEVKVSRYNKDMVAKEKQSRTDLTKKIEDARLSGTMDRTYAREMTNQAEMLLNELNAITSKPPAPAFKRFTEPAAKNLIPIRDAFAKFEG